MCGACEHVHGRRRTSTRVLLVVFVGAFVALSVAGLVMRIGPSERISADACEAASSAAVRFQSAVTRDIDQPALLRSDTVELVSELRSLGAAGCPETRRFLVSAETTIAGLCPRCASDLRRVRCPPPDPVSRASGELRRAVNCMQLHGPFTSSL